MQGITQNTAAYFRPSVYHGLCLPVCPGHAALSDITGSDYDPVTQQITVTLGGNTDMPTEFYLFSDVEGFIQQSLIDVATFDGSAQVVVDVSVQPDTTPPTVSCSTTPATEEDIDVSTRHGGNGYL